MYTSLRLLASAPPSLPARLARAGVSVALGVAALVALLGSPGELTAQTAGNLEICIVPGSGTVYVTGETGTPSACTKATHLERLIPLIGAGSVTTAMLADAAVTNAKLANASVTVVAGAGLSGGGTVALGGSVTVASAGITGRVRVTQRFTVAGTSSFQQWNVDCPAGKEVVGGGFGTPAFTEAIKVKTSIPNGAAQWTVTTSSAGATTPNDFVDVHAICVNVAP